jgi:hypothetical protein
VRFLFATLQDFESDFYGRVGEDLTRLGHHVEHVTYSRRASSAHRRRGIASRSLLDVMAELPAFDVAAEAARIEQEYGIPSIRDVYRTDVASAHLDEDAASRRTVAHFLALERVFDDARPDVVVPEVGSEVIRTAAHLIALERGIVTFFLLYTLFPRPLRLAADSLQAPIVAADDMRELTPGEREELYRFRTEFLERGTPIRPYRRAAPTASRLRGLARYTLARLGDDRDNDYTRPLTWTVDNVRAWGRLLTARAMYTAVPSDRPFVYFPLHDIDDYKIKRLVPHLADQASIVEQVAAALPAGYDLVLKEHPMSVGRTPLSVLQRLRRVPNIRIVAPLTSTHDLIERADAVAVISSTVGLEALFYAKPVLTLGAPFYSGHGITLDAESTAEIQELVPALLRFAPDPERIDRFLHAAMRAGRAGAPVMVDRSDENALALAGSLAQAAAELDLAHAHATVAIR